MKRAMLCENNLSKYFWVEAVDTACYVLTRVLFQKFFNKILYELWNGKKINVSYFRAFRCKSFVLNISKDKLGNFNAKSDEGVFLGYSTPNKACRVFKKKNLVVKELVHVNFDEIKSLPRNIISDDVDDMEQTMDKLDINQDTSEAPKEKEDQYIISSQQDVNQGLPEEC